MIFRSSISGSPQQQQQQSRGEPHTEVVASLVNAKKRELRSAQKMEQQVATSAGGYGQLLEGATDRLRKLIWTTTSTSTAAQADEQQADTQAKQETQQDTQKKSSADWQLKRKYTLSEVRQHATLDDCWMVIFDKVYDITDFVHEHPGGDFILFEYAGRDSTQPFLSSRHGSSAYKMLDKYWIGILVDEELYYSNNSSYCSVYSSLSWRSTPTLEEKQPEEVQTQETTSSGESALETSAEEEEEDEEEDEDEEQTTKAAPYTSDDDDEQEDYDITSEHSANCITIREEPRVPELEQEFASVPQQQQLLIQLSKHTTPNAISTMLHNNNSITTTTTTTTTTESTNTGTWQPQRQALLMIEHNIGRAGFFVEDHESQEELDEDESDVDSDFGEEQSQCNSCSASSQASSTAVTISTRPQAIHRSASATARLQQTSTTFLHESTSAFRWRLRNRDQFSLFSQQFH